MDGTQEPKDADPTAGTPDVPDAPTRPAPADDDESSDNDVALAIAFAVPGAVLMLLLEDARVVGLPFLVLGLFYFAKVIRSSMVTGKAAPAADGPAEDGPTDAAGRGGPTPRA
ncbi:hypothetical protein C5E16_11415 [Clavibacter michiganensis]|uniref:Uncharacterized protein n=1 Tax=Clavibacter michiganensis TaxID=28447 RepID=A0A2S5VSA4_9MICO|nr:hypothetical protein [Clavibacter michiganensis]PPF66555.1 hypothetical protein C5E16_11415 [Clavibacter michiganensis]